MLTNGLRILLKSTTEVLKLVIIRLSWLVSLKSFSLLVPFSLEFASLLELPIPSCYALKNLSNLSGCVKHFNAHFKNISCQCNDWSLRTVCIPFILFYKAFEW